MKNNKYKKALIGISGSFGVLLAGLIIFLISGYYAGWDIIGWFTSKTALLIYFLIVLLFLASISLVLYLKYRKKK